MDFTFTVDTTGEPERLWRRASRCTSNGCVEIAFMDDKVAVRDSKQSPSSVLLYDHDEWRVFVEGVKAGEFDLEQVRS